MMTKRLAGYVKSLEKKSVRDETGYFVAEGVKLVAEALDSDLEIPHLFITGDVPGIGDHLLRKAGEIHPVSPGELKRISFQKAPNSVLCVVKKPSHRSDETEIREKLCLVLDHIQDPGNVGTIIRTAGWFGFSSVYCCGRTADPFGPKAVQAAMGAVFRLRIHTADIKDILRTASESGTVPVYGALLSGEDIYTADLPSGGGGLIVLGNESKGISPELRPFLTGKLFIPPAGESLAAGESLNVAAAAAVICSEFARRRKRHFLQEAT